MSSVVIAGNTSGTVTLDAPDVAGSTVLTLPATSGTLNTSGAVNEVPAGTAAAPAITTTGDTNTGIFFPAADTIAFAEGGVEAMRIDSSGNVGIGNASDNNTRRLSFTTASGGSSAIESVTAGATDQALVFKTTFATETEKMRITGGGNVGIGTSSPGNKLHVSATSQADADGLIRAENTATTPSSATNTSLTAKNYYGTSQFMQWEANGLRIGSRIVTNGGAGNVIFTTGSDAERMRIDSSGNLLVGTTSDSQTSGNGVKIKPNTYGVGFPSVEVVTAGTSSSSGYTLYSTGAGAYRFYVQDSGQINATSTSIIAISDVTLKENIRDLETGLTEVMNLKPRRFDWKEETKLEAKNVAGFIAQEVEAVLPELVYDYNYNKNESKKSLKMGDMLPTLVKAIQELKAELDVVKAELNTLKGN
jgi:hypothetical protein